MSDGQLQFLQYVRFYKSLNELPAQDRPAPEVVDDDAALDEWWEQYLRQLAAGQTPSMGGGHARGISGGFQQPSVVYGED